MILVPLDSAAVFTYSLGPLYSYMCISLKYLLNNPLLITLGGIIPCVNSVNEHAAINYAPSGYFSSYS